MSAALTKFQELLALSKVNNELHSAIGLRDRSLAEFVLSLARKSQNVDYFTKELAANGAEFDQDMINTIYAIVTRIFPRDRDSHLADIFERANSPTAKSDGSVKRGEKPKPDLGERGDDAYDEEKNKKVKKELTKQFPGLSVPNKVVKDDDEIELDLDDLNDALKSVPKPMVASSPPPMARKSR